MGVRVVMNRRNIKALTENQKTALVQAVDAAKTELIELKIMPFDVGILQNQSTYIDESKRNQGRVDIVSDTPYAERLYFSPNFNFQQVNNRFAGAYWFEPFITGYKKDFIKKAYAQRLRILNERTGG